MLKLVLLFLLLLTNVSFAHEIFHELKRMIVDEELGITGESCVLSVFEKGKIFFNTSLKRWFFKWSEAKKAGRD